MEDTTTEHSHAPGCACDLAEKLIEAKATIIIDGKAHTITRGDGAGHYIIEAAEDGEQ